MKSESRKSSLLIAPLSALLFVTPAIGQDRSVGRDPADAHLEVGAPAAKLAAPLDGPVVPTEAGGWAGSMLIIVAAMFVMAAMIGPIVRAEMPAEEPAAHDDHGNDSHGHDSHGHDSHGHDSHGHDSHGHGH